MRNERLFFGDRRQVIAAFGLGLLLLVAFAPTLVELVRELWTVPEYGHGLLMPPFAAWLVWERRRELAAMRRVRHPADPPVAVLAALGMLVCVTILVLGEMKYSWAFKPYAFVGCLALCVALLFGWRGLGALWKPLFVLFLMCPIPWRVILGITLPLKRYATVLATGLVDVSGLPVTLHGNVMNVEGANRFLIEDACSGVRSFVSLVAVTLLGFLFWRRHWSLKVIVLAATVPVAVGVNSLRIWGTALLSIHVNPKFAQGVYHTFEGFLLFGLAAAVLGVFALLLHVVVPRSDDDAAEGTDGDVADLRAQEAGLPVVPFRRSFTVGFAALALCAGIFYVYSTRARLGGEAVNPAVVAQLQQRLHLPVSVPGYEGRRIEWNRSTIDKSGADAYSAVAYTDEGGRSFTVYVGAALRNNDNFHAPNVCMPSQGWESLEHDTNVALPGGGRMQRLLLQAGMRQKLVYFWFHAGVRQAPSEWAVRRYRLWDLFKGAELSPTMIVSVYADVDGTKEGTEQAARAFLATIRPYLDEAVTGGIHG